MQNAVSAVILSVKEKKLRDLFSEWKDGTQTFCPDGMLGGGEECEILFICRESNIGNGYENAFWLRKVVDARTADPSHYYDPGIGEKSNHTSQGKYYACLLHCARSLLGDDADLRRCAYMNINKLGGGRTCDWNVLEHYAEKDREYIRREIEIISPKRIVVLGKLYREKIVKVIAESCGGFPIYQYKRHPARWMKSLVPTLCDGLHPLE